jgi:hypothetical protein
MRQLVEGLVLEVVVGGGGEEQESGRLEGIHSKFLDENSYALGVGRQTVATGGSRSGEQSGRILSVRARWFYIVQPGRPCRGDEDEGSRSSVCASENTLSRRRPSLLASF